MPLLPRFGSSAPAPPRGVRSGRSVAAACGTYLKSVLNSARSFRRPAAAAARFATARGGARARDAAAAALAHGHAADALRPALRVDAARSGAPRATITDACARGDEEAGSGRRPRGAPPAGSPADPAARPFDSASGDAEVAVARVVRRGGPGGGVPPMIARHDHPVQISAAPPRSTSPLGAAQPSRRRRCPTRSYRKSWKARLAGHKVKSGAVEAAG